MFGHDPSLASSHIHSRACPSPPPQALYCNRDCQVNHYTIHQANCAQLAAQPSAAQLTDVARKRDIAPQNGGAEPSTASPAPAAAAPVRKPKKEKAAAKQPQQQQQSTPPNDKEKQRGSYTVFKCEQVHVMS